jgi:CHAD domain-containing protein
MVQFLNSGAFEQQLSRIVGVAGGLRKSSTARWKPGKDAPRQTARLLRRPAGRVISAIERVRSNPGSAPAFHGLRIEIKRLRYAVEFLHPALPFAHLVFLKRMRAAQTQLGALQDATVELGLIKELQARVGADRQAKAILQRFEASRGRDHRRLLAACKRLLDPLEAEVHALLDRERATR